ncbi:MAG TPA: cupin domain-containing protein [Ktedonobacteraceae bacterium]|nr:cupin domain-containing protein [Ktedonobacteraceae bacterium]
MDAFEMAPLVAEQNQQNLAYLEFLRTPSLSLGLYKLAAGAVDLQVPHSEDEVYYVVKGQGTILVGTEHREVEAGSIIFVGAHVEHRFHTITEDLLVLVFFAPAEGSQSTHP